MIKGLVALRNTIKSKLMSQSILNVKPQLCHYGSMNVLRSLIKSGFGIVIWAAAAVS